MKQLPVILLLMGLLLIPTVTAEETRSCSLDETQLVTERSILTNVTGSTQQYFTNETIDCPYGCDNVTVSCKPPTFIQNFYLLGLIAGIVGIALAITKMK